MSKKLSKKDRIKAQQDAFEKEKTKANMEQKISILNDIVAQEGGLYRFQVLLADFMKIKREHLIQYINNKKFMFNNEEMRMATAVYEADGTTCITVFDSKDLPYAKLTVCIPEASVCFDEILIKTWSENKELTDCMRDFNWIKYGGRKYDCPNGVEAEIWRIKGI